MGRHASGTNNYALSGRAIAAIVAVAIVLIAAVAWALRPREGDPQAAPEPPSCVAGELELPIAAADKRLGEKLAHDYAATSPVVRDYCINPTVVDSVADAAVYIAPNTPVAHQELAQRGRTAATSEPSPVAAVKVGVAHKGGPAEAKLGEVTFPVDEEPAASALVASALAANDEEAVEALTARRAQNLAGAAEVSDFVATSEGNVPAGYTFSPVEGEVVYTAIPLNQADSISEEQARAGQDFAKAMRDPAAADAGQQPAISDLVWAAATPSGGENITQHTDPGAKLADGGPMDTLFLLDTSEAMAPYMTEAERGIADAARAVAASGKSVALWNYSSPLNPGVVNGYRRNVALTPDAEAVADAVGRFLNGGVPRTREAVTAAVSESAGSTRIVVVTTGTADGGDDNAFIAGIDNANIAVVHVGEGQQDQALRGAAKSAAEAQRGDQVAPAIKAAAGIAG
ncbi:hypothetical protein [Corynebacterium liangguodongii]|uniref:Uncharacterized protein n=1 Tax=Corynebacterium liangguodongii TaxID=2079535 RepID=A0A2S0WE89_9CORY|nr:hypothetical protein [Corynebacterium liangguodongii]AWB83982.1 hypothetical protein C3E79_05395 [Corynebacterium liangguodongii]PWB99993.1 hypothetical protein DF219_02035 [Corynebacterium liangguodongii]